MNAIPDSAYQVYKISISSSLTHCRPIIKKKIVSTLRISMQGKEKFVILIFIITYIFKKKYLV